MGNLTDIINRITGKISKKVSEKFSGEDNKKISEALIELIIKVKANFIKDSSFLSVCFPVPIEDNEHKILEYRILDEKEYLKFNIEDGLAILNFKKRFNKGDRETCKIYFKLKNQAYKSARDTNPERFLNPQKYTSLSNNTKKFLNQFKGKNTKEIINKISSWIFLNLRYSDIDEMKDAEWIFKNKIGNCVHYSTLFIAFCRYFGIPSRYVLGFAKYGRFWPHTWVEFYDEENFSWVPMDLSLNQRFFVDATHIPISRLDERQIKRYFKEVNIKIPDDYDEIFKIMNFGTESVVEEDAHVEIDVRGRLI